MKTIVRVIVLSLVAAGAYASTHTNYSRPVATAQVHSQLAPNFMPMPGCTPTHGCGVIKGGGN